LQNSPENPGNFRLIFIIRRTLIIEVAATEEGCLEIAKPLQPTDFVRFPGENNWLFCWYLRPGEYPKLWKVNRKAGTIKRRLTLEEAERQEALDLLDKLNNP
jgi:hypothetical protein